MKSGGARKLALMTAVATAALGLGALAPAATAGPSDWSGFGYVDLVHAKVSLTTPIIEGSVSPALAEVNSAGLTGGAKSHAVATQVSGEIAPISQGGSLLTSAEQSAPPDNAAPQVSELLALPDALGPLVKASVAKATAWARWPGANGCPPAGSPVSEAFSHVADARVINDTGTPLGTSLATIDNNQGSTVFTHSTTSLVNVAGSDKRGLKAEALTQLTAITLFKGTSNELTVNVLAPPVVTAIATGRPGGASVTYTEPVLQIVQNGNVQFELNAATANFTLPSNPLIRLQLGTLTKTEAANGTSAAGEAALLLVEVLPAPTVGTDPVVHLSIANGFVSATVPVGGIDCKGGPSGPNPLDESHKDATVADATPGASFDYNVAVPNRGTCTLTEVKVVDTVTGPDGTTITKTVPAATSVDGLTATWDDIGPLAPNATKTLTLTIKVPADAPVGAVYHNTAVITAKCDGADVSKTVNYTGPTVGAAGLGGCTLDFSNKASSHKEVRVGESFNYYIHVFNSGGKDCANTKVVDTLIAHVTFVSCSDGCTQNGSKLTWNLGTVAANSGRTLVVTVKAASAATAGEHLKDTAVISADGSSITVSTDGPLVSGNSVLAPPNPAARGVTTGVLGTKLPRTGASAAVAIAAMALLSGGVLLRRRLRAEQL